MFAKKACNIFFHTSKNEKITLPYEFIFVFIQYFNGAIMLEKSCQVQGVWEKYENLGNVYRRVGFKPAHYVSHLSFNRGILAEEKSVIHQVIFCLELYKHLMANNIGSLFLVAYLKLAS